MGLNFNIVSIDEAQDIYRAYMERLQKRIKLAHEQSAYIFKLNNVI